MMGRSEGRVVSGRVLGSNGSFKARACCLEGMPHLLALWLRLRGRGPGRAVTYSLRQRLAALQEQRDLPAGLRTKSSWPLEKRPAKRALTPFGEAQGMLREPQGERFPLNSVDFLPRSP
jgi:hypothetical protein